MFVEFISSKLDLTYSDRLKRKGKQAENWKEWTNYDVRLMYDFGFRKL